MSPATFTLTSQMSFVPSNFLKYSGGTIGNDSTICRTHVTFLACFADKESRNFSTGPHRCEFCKRLSHAPIKVNIYVNPIQERIDGVCGGDYDSDGKLDMTVFRPSTGIWPMLQSSNGYYLDRFNEGESPVMVSDGKVELY